MTSPGSWGGGEQHPLLRPTSGDVEIRPSRHQLRAFLTGLPLLLVVVVVVSYYRYGLESVPWTIVLSVVPLGLLWLYMARSSVRMDALTLTRRGMVLTRSFARADARDVVLAPYQANPGDSRIVLTLFVRDQAGRRILRLTSAIWHPADLEMLAHSIGPRPAVYQEVLTPAMHEKLHPGSTKIGERQPGRTRAVIVVTTFVVLGAMFYVLYS